jgi:hypothetical protein
MIFCSNEPESFSTKFPFRLRQHISLINFVPKIVMPIKMFPEAEWQGIPSFLGHPLVKEEP